MTHRRPIGERLFALVIKTETCWLYGGHLVNGYGLIRVGGRGGRRVRVHRVSYELAKGPIPEGLVLDHLCRVKNCVNPDHLEAVTQAENLRRGLAPAAVNARLEVCKKEGHPLTPDNNVGDTPGHRRCRKCRQAWERERSKRRVAQARVQREGQVAA